MASLDAPMHTFEAIEIADADRKALRHSRSPPWQNSAGSDKKPENGKFLPHPDTDLRCRFGFRDGACAAAISPTGSNGQSRPRAGVRAVVAGKLAENWHNMHVTDIPSWSIVSCTTRAGT
jgi:hypothetical protein